MRHLVGNATVLLEVRGKNRVHHEGACDRMINE
jgi:hypothetical protein